MKFDFPQVDLPCEILAWNDVTEDILNIYKQSCRLKAGIFAICTEGKMTATINLIDYEIKPNDLITLLPGTIIQFRERTEKSTFMLCGILIGMRRTHQSDKINGQFLLQNNRMSDCRVAGGYSQLSDRLFFFAGTRDV